MPGNPIENPIFYVTRSRERASGLPQNDSYKIISGDGSKDTLELLSDEKIQKEIKKNNASVLVFKNTIQIERLAKEKEFKLLNPSAELAEEIENKVTQAKWLGELSDFLPPHHITLVKKITKDIFPSKDKDDHFILQWAHSHTGEGTIHIKKRADLEKIQKDFPERETRISEYIKGPVFTSNIVVSPDKILIGNISYQITGLKPFTDNIFSTIGNDWGLPHSILSESQLEKFNKIATAVAEKMQKSGWKGLFGIDVIHAEEKDEMHLIEINARQPASTTYESELQQISRSHGVPGMTTFEAHVAALTNKPLTSLIGINDGAQIIQRVTREVKKLDTSELKNEGYRITEYNNSKANADLVRIQNTRGIMESHNKFNKRGKVIKEIIEKQV